MVIRLLLLFFAVASIAPAQEISVEIETAKLSGFDRISVKVRIVHDEEEKVDEREFRKGGSPISVKLEKREKLGEGKVASIYSFKVPIEGQGLQLLSEISVPVGGKRIKSPPTSYEVRREKMERPLYLKFHIEGEEPFFPGQRIKFIYEIFYQGNVVLEKEKLPLLEPEGFKKLGEVIVDERVEGDYTVQTLTQEVKVLESGEYSFEASVLEGEADLQEVKAAVPPINIVVLPFEREGQPLSFNGAIGSYSIDTKLLTSPDMVVGDTARLQINVTGRGDLSTVKMPEIICQPGFSGFFSLSDIPPIAKEVKDGKAFIIELRPNTPAVKEIPSIHFSYFDPQINLYESVSSKPIPINVGRIGRETFEEVKLVAETVDWEAALNDVSAGIPSLRPPAEGEKKLDHWLILWMVPLAVLAGLLQWIWKRNRKRVKTEKTKSKDLLNEAKGLQENTAKFAETMKKAIRLACEEEGKDLEEAKAFFDRMDAVRYGKKEKPSKGELYKEGKNLWRSIKNSS